MGVSDDLLPAGSGWPWTAALVVGPPLAGKGEFVAQLLAAGLDAGEGAVIVSTDESAADLLDRYPALDHDGLRVVDATGADHDDARVSVVRSPADLTGLGMAFDDAVTSLLECGYERVRVGIDALTTLELYTGPERVSRFVHVLTRRFESVGCTGLYVVHGEEPATELTPYADAHIEFRDGGQVIEYRVDGPTGPTDWHVFEPDDHVHASAPTATGETPVAVDSLGELVEQVDAEPLTLTVVNADPDTIDRIEPLFDRLEVDVRAGSLDTDEPAGVALLHRGSDLLASDPVATLLAAVEGVDDHFPDTSVESAVLDSASRSLHSVDTTRRAELVQTSRLVEIIAAGVGGGTLHAGFQQLSRLADDPDTMRIYRWLTDRGVDVHLYGESDATLPDGFTVHGAPTEELTESWFVVFDGDDSSHRMGALVCTETEADHYWGFWTYRPSLVAGLATYLDSEYGSLRTEQRSV